MATAAESTFIAACIVAEGTRQNSVATAFATFSAAGFSSAALAAYRNAVIAAENAYRVAVLTAANSGNIDPSPCEFQPFGGTNAFVGNTPGIQGGQ